MKFEYIIMLIMVVFIGIGSVLSKKKINELTNKLNKQVVDTLTIEIPFTILDTMYITTSDTIYADADTIYSESIADAITIYKYGTYTSSFNTPLVYGTAIVNTRHNEWSWNIKHRNFELNLEFPDKYDFSSVIATTTPDLGPISISLNDEYIPLKKSKGFVVAVGIGYDYTQEVFLMGDISWKKHRLGILQGKDGRGYYYNRVLWSF